MQAHETKLQQVIEGIKQYVVPLFQRPYSWDTKQWKQLWEDIKELSDDDSPRTHFMGSMVTSPTQSVPEGVSKYLLIDGQQRMTTVLVLLACIRDRARDLGVGTLAPEIEQTLLKNMFQQGNDAFKLLPTQGDRDTFFQVIAGPPIPSDAQIARAYSFYASRLRQEPDLDLEKLKRVVVSKLVLVSIVLDRDDNPHLIFESLNAKGRPLTQADLIRNYFFMRIHVNEQIRLYAQFWKPMQDRLGEYLTEFIRHFLMKDGAIVKQDSVYFALKEIADEKSDAEVVKYLEELMKYAGYYSWLLHPEQAPGARIRERLNRLNRIEVTIAYPFLLNLCRDYETGALPEDRFVAIMDLIENFMIRRWICGVPTYGLNKVLTPLYAQASQYDDLVLGVRESLSTKNYPRDLEFSTGLRSAKLYGPGERLAKTRLVLERLEDSFGHQEPVNVAELSVEHVMPQTLTPSWRNQLGENWESLHESLLHTLGNLTLTGYNATMSNEDFARKREVLLDSHLELNRFFSDLQTWDEATIRQRAEWLGQIALRVWPYFGQQRPQAAGSTGDITGRTPLAVLVAGQRFPVATWRDVAQQTLEAVATLDPERFEELLVEFPKFIGRDASTFRSVRRLSNGAYMQTNLSAAQTHRYCVQVIQAIGLGPDDWRVEVA